MYTLMDRLRMLIGLRPAPAELVSAQVLRQLRGKVPQSIAAQAISRAERNITNGVARDEAVRRALAWANSADHSGPKAHKQGA